ncbi:hypothetical protein ASPSYDRAFT_88255 [Aspergillus sydowii CBS 593.65]|uniref:CFEM domain-containing protein n=1 Tax=Aspergillus sydowii CBS 593.65 TaxID=1036612 RepID=A0A1L9TIS5_9EURO|nr:uncharacterized protein ASPSYDRAFT_88255 [Aspergillus sydowii CBS 593.65]OJJ59327.1 hypothetical protein ASPSYDRAFT_88255 [Aspergillus sydowii CBS 593.65]
MKIQSLALAFAACLSSAAAQGMSGLPSCAQNCATDAIPSECSLIDVNCICKTKSFIDDMACCVGKSCDSKDQDAALEFANGICGGAGITDLPQSATCAGGSTTTSTESTPSGTATTSTSSEDASETSSSASQSATPSPSETPADPEATDGAVLLQGKGVGVLAGIVAGVAFVL